MSTRSYNNYTSPSSARSRLRNSYGPFRAYISGASHVGASSNSCAHSSTPSSNLNSVPFLVRHTARLNAHHHNQLQRSQHTEQPPAGHRGIIKALLVRPLPDCLNLLHGVLGFSPCRLRGQVKLLLIKPLIAKRVIITLTLVVTEKIHVSMNKGSASSTKSTSTRLKSTHQIHNSSASNISSDLLNHQNILFEHQLNVLSKEYSVEGEAILHSGEHLFPFNIDSLPDWLPGTLHSKHSSIVYTLKVSLSTSPLPSQQFPAHTSIATCNSSASYSSPLTVCSISEVPMPRFHPSLLKQAAITMSEHNTAASAVSCSDIQKVSFFLLLRVFVDAWVKTHSKRTIPLCSWTRTEMQ
jgi:hypothetical protein